MASAHDYELSINGTRIGRGQSFDYSSETHYQGWDITEALGDDDTISIGVLDRWYSGGQGRQQENQVCWVRLLFTTTMEATKPSLLERTG